MTLNPFAYLRERKLERKQQEARAGKTSSGYLSPGERQGMFRRRSK